MRGVFITFEGTEGSGKSTQVQILSQRLREMNLIVRLLREPGGTPIGEEIRHTLKHSEANRAMTSEAEMLLMNASRAQLVREVIRPALAAGEIVICDRFYDSTTVYQGYGRGLDLKQVAGVIDFAVGDTRPDLTILLNIPLDISETRRQSRQALLLEVPARNVSSPLSFTPIRDRMEEADRAFFERVETGYQTIAQKEPERIRVIDATESKERVTEEIWKRVEPVIKKAQASR